MFSLRFCHHCQKLCLDSGGILSKNLPKLKAKIQLGILSFSNNRYIPTFSSKKEIKAFDFYCDYDEKIYMNGKQIHIPNGGG